MRETFFEVVAHAAPVGLAVLRRDGVVEFANPALAALVGFEVTPGAHTTAHASPGSVSARR
jgi:hypothetical protein